MDPLHYGRISAAGWLFIAVAALTLWLAKAPEWNAFLTVLADKKPSVLMSLSVAALGLAGPPLIGATLERVATLLLRVLKWDMWSYPANARAYELLSTISLGTLPRGTGALHAVLYSGADSRVIEWIRRRTTQVYSALCSVLAIWLAVVVTAVVFSVSSMIVLLLATAATIFLLIYAKHVSDACSSCVEAWVLSYGALHIQATAKASIRHRDHVGSTNPTNAEEQSQDRERSEIVDDAVKHLKDAKDDA